MHVEALTPLVPGEVMRRISRRGHTAGHVDARIDPMSVDLRDALRCELERTPPKIFLPARPSLIAPAAELRVDPLPQGSHVVLRLMWGPLPAPFPRALAGVGLVLALSVLVLWPASWLGAGVAALLAIAPAVALWRQRSGERRLQDRLSMLLGGCIWSPRTH